MLARRNLPLNALRAFEAVARAGNMRQAAVELGVTHGAVSRQVRLLEEQLAAPLFERTHNRLVLTAAGHRLFDTVRQALDSIAESTQYLNPESMAGPLSILTTPSLSSYWVVSLAGRFSQVYPEVEIHIELAPPSELVLTSSFDVALCYGRPREPAWPARRLYGERYFPVASPRLLARGRGELKPAHLLDYPLLHDRHELWPRWLDAQGLGGRRAVRNLYLQESFQAVMAARDGVGLMLADAFEVAADLQSGSLVKLMDASIESTDSVFLVHAPEPRLHVRARLFIDFVDRWLASVQDALFS